MVGLRIVSLVSAAVLCLGVVGACRQSSVDESDYTEEQAREFLKVGIERRAISARFGEPVSETVAADGGVVLVYHRPFRVRGTESPPQTVHFTGFTVYLREGKLVRWEPIIGNTSAP